MKSQTCEFAEECPIYNGIETVSETPITVFKNVFCKRGQQGWNNCQRYKTIEAEGNTGNTQQI